jgi:uncharacterized membrane protein
MLLGMLLASVSGPFWHPEIGVLVICIVPMILDGGVQRVTAYESTNIRRLITGLLFGYGFLLLVVLYLAAVYRLGHSFGVQWQ